MRTRRECLEKAARCEQLARTCSTSMNERILLETAKHWRGLARSCPPRSPSDRDGRVSPPPIDVPIDVPIDDATTASMLAGLGCLIR